MENDTLDLSEILTVFVITVSNDINYEDCLLALQNQTVKFKLEIIKDYAPLSKAFQEMLNRCQTPYYVEVDSDMILNPNAIEKLYNKILTVNIKTPIICFKLEDVHLNFAIYGVKIYNYNIFKNFPYNLKHPSCEVEQLKRMEQKGYNVKIQDICINEIIGKHSPKWTEETIFERYYNLMEKEKLFHYDWLKTLPQKLINIYKKSPTTLNFYAIAGALSSIYSDKTIQEEKNFNIKRPNFQKLQKIIVSDVPEKEVVSVETKKLNITKIIDEFGWAYYYITKDMMKYSGHNIKYIRLKDIVSAYVPIKDPDIYYFSSPCLGLNNVTRVLNTLKTKAPNIKIIGGYASESTLKYPPGIDIIITASYNWLPKLKEMYPNLPVIWLPECVDTEYFQPQLFNANRFNVGFCGRTGAVKRIHLQDKLKHPVKRQSEHGVPYFYDGITLNKVREFYKSIDVLILTSSSECMPRVVLEAMAMGLPVVSTRVGSLPLVLGKEWLIDVNPESEVISQMNLKLDELKSRPILREVVGNLNRAKIEKYYSWKKYMPLWDRVFSALMNKDYETIYKIEKEYLGLHK
jgi:glycosyltransferase involved in cell wall biosynthesis